MVRSSSKVHWGVPQKLMLRTGFEWLFQLRSTIVDSIHPLQIVQMFIRRIRARNSVMDQQRYGPKERVKGEILTSKDFHARLGFRCGFSPGPGVASWRPPPGINQSI